MLRMNEDHEYFWDDERVPGVNEILKDLGIIDTTFFSEEGAIRGKNRHTLLDDYDEGGVDWGSVSDDDSHIIVGWTEFREEYALVPKSIELPVYDTQRHIAGTIDRIMVGPDGTLWLVDIKTGSPDKWHSLQIQIYRNAFENFTGLTIHRAGCCYLRKAKKKQFRFKEVEWFDVGWVTTAWQWQNRKWEWID